MTDTSSRIAVVGAGAAGTLTALHLLRSAGAGCEVVLIDPATTGQGVAYSTTDRRHRLNVRVRALSALPEDPEHLLRWARQHEDAAVGPDDFLPREAYGRYLADALAESAAGSAATLTRCYDTATSAEQTPLGVTLQLLTGGTVTVDTLVLAPGSPAPGTNWAPQALRSSPRFVADPWAPGALEALHDVDTVLLVGTGLTMVDLALSLARPGRVLHAISRHGLLPRAHRAALTAPHPAPALPDGPLDYPAATELVRAHLAAATRATGDWRAAFDSLRAVTPSLWQLLTTEARAEFVRSGARNWDVRRHRMAPQVADEIVRIRQRGELAIGPGEIGSVSATADGLLVELTDGRTMTVGAVVNCTGPGSTRTLTDPLLASIARPDALGLGLDVDPHGHLLDDAGMPSARIVTVGSARRGQSWESTAVPEIRAQAAEFARRWAAEHASTATPLRRRTSLPRDRYGLVLTTSAEAAAAFELAQDRLLQVQSAGADALLDAVAADPDFALAHATLALVGHEQGAPVDVDAELALAERCSAAATDRERSFVAAVAGHIRGASPAGLIGHLRAHPRDALALSVAVPTIAFAGVTEVPEQAWELVEGLAPAYGEDWWYAGMLAFVRQEQERYDEAVDLADRALAVKPGYGHAVHAKAHSFYETGEHEAGLRWLTPWVESCGRGASHRAHFSWHAALHELALDDTAALALRYSAQLAPPHVSGMRALVDSGSLLWRCSMRGTRPGPILDVLTAAGSGLLGAPATPFAAFHLAIVLLAADDAAGLGRLAEDAASRLSPVFPAVVAPLARGLQAVAEHRWHDAVELLLPLEPTLGRLGGSAAQREVIQDTTIFALVHAERLVEAGQLLQKRLDRRPSPADAAALSALAA